MLKNFNPRLYQETIFSTCTLKNTLVVLPTGLGKTMIALMLAAQRLKQYPQSKILFLAPTKPLVEQHLQTFIKQTNISEKELIMFTGTVNPKKREELWNVGKIFFSTPQGLENDVINGRIKLDDVSLLVVDEAHRTVGDYAYVFLAKQYQEKAKRPRILALTASPGTDKQKIHEVMNNLFIEEIELRTETDSDVKDYIQEMEIDWIPLELPEELKKVQEYLTNCFRSKIQAVKLLGFYNGSLDASRTELLRIQGALHGSLGKGEKSIELMKSLSLLAEAMKVQHAIELVETQGITPLHEYMNKIYEDSKTSKTKAVQNLVRDVNFKIARIAINKLLEQEIDHPKLDELKKIIKNQIIKNSNSKIIIFSQFRDTAVKIHEELETLSNISSKVFVGQAKKKNSGLTQKEQKKIIEDFKNEKFNCLIATSVAEEGLDIPSVDLVLFYEPVPSGIRTIQRRGRTGRQSKGKVMILMTKNTRDEVYKWSAHHKERKMKRVLQEIIKSPTVMRETQKKLSLPKASNNSLNNYLQKEKQFKIIVDHREKSSRMLKQLIDKNILIEQKQLIVGDYLLSNRCAVEYKKVLDFVNSIIDGRLLSQIKSLKQNYEKPLLIIEGKESLFSQRSIHPNAVRGMIATITVAYGIPIIMTTDENDTAEQLIAIAKREQDETTTQFNPHSSKKSATIKEQQEYLISSMPKIGVELAKRLLEQFGTIKKIINASAKDLETVESIGTKKAEEIQKLLTTTYEKENK